MGQSLRRRLRGTAGESSDEEGEELLSEGVEADEIASRGGESWSDESDKGGEGGSGHRSLGSHALDPPTDNSCNPTSQALTISDVRVSSSASESAGASEGEDGLKQT